MWVPPASFFGEKRSSGVSISETLARFQEGEVEIRQVFEAEDFGEAFTPELREQERKLGIGGAT